MELEKKPKRPRIGATPIAGSSDAADKAAHSGEKPISSNDYQPRQYGERPYQQRPYNPYQQNRYSNHYPSGNYQQSDSAKSDATPAEGATRPESSNTEGGYQRRPQGGYQPRQQGGYQPRQQGYQPRQQGGYQPRQNGYNQGGYRQQEGGYQPRQNSYNQGGYQQRGPQQGGYRQQGQGGYQQRGPQQGGYRQQGQGGYQQRGPQQGGYRQQGGHGGYQQRGPQQGGYRQQGGQRGGYQKQPQRFTPRPKQIEYVLEDIDPNEPIRLNKYMANAGICSRREADEYIQKGLVKVNGEVVTELGSKINRNDRVEYDEKIVVPEKKCYVLLNKPKDCVTTSDDPNGRLTVLDLVKNACPERIYPVGRLDRNTTGVLLLTNDGDLASKLTHPKYVKKKIYHVWTDKDITEEDMQRIADGIELDDGEIHADAISYVSETDRNQAGIEIHSGRNRIVRRIFEHLGYRVVKLDRVYFAGLTKKNLPRGRWRYLTQEEVNFLRMGSFE